MRASSVGVLLLLAVGAYAAVAEETAPDTTVLWSMGVRDGSGAELALGPDGWERFSKDADYLVGLSRPEKDWPFIHPGPFDSWAGDKPHAFRVLFHLARAGEEGVCRLRLDLVDANPTSPELMVVVNGHSLSQRVPAGSGGDAHRGDTSKSKPIAVTYEIPAGHLREGVNELSIVSAWGSWMVYDAVTFEAPKSFALAPSPTAFPGVPESPIVLKRGEANRLFNVVRIPLHNYGAVTTASVRVGELPAVETELAPGARTVEVQVPAVEREQTLPVVVTIGDREFPPLECSVMPVRPWTCYLLAHSHTDFLWLRPPAQILEEYSTYLDTALELAERTADYGPEAQYKWNMESLFFVDHYLKIATPDKRKRFFDGVRQGVIGLDGFYGGALTALGRREEAGRQFRFAHKLEEECGVPVDAAMLSDVPGFSWGTIAAMAHAGIKYLSTSPNPGDPWYKLHADRPFYWVTPDGGGRVLCWVTGTAYVDYPIHRPPFDMLRSAEGEKLFSDYLARLQKADYFPYDIAIVRACSGDQSGPLPELSDVVKKWNETYAYPRLVVATTSQAFRAFEERYGGQLPERRGEWTGYWEDGAASSARETGLSRTAADRLVQAETLWAIVNPDRFPAERFAKAWKNIFLFSEHSWGSFMSAAEPDAPLTWELWNKKKSFADTADMESRSLLREAVTSQAGAKPVLNAVDIFNTASWARGGIVEIPETLSSTGDAVRDAQGRRLPSQRLSTGALAVRVPEVPAFGALRIVIEAAEPLKEGSAAVAGSVLKSDLLEAAVDPETGDLARLRLAGLDHDFAGPEGVNKYVYIFKRDSTKPQYAGACTVRVKESGPLVSSLVVESEAPGCRKLWREIRVEDGSDVLRVTNRVDKLKELEKETALFTFPFHVPEGRVRYDMQWAVVDPACDAMEGSVRNDFIAQQWVDVSNADCGVTWASIDAPQAVLGEALDAWVDWAQPPLPPTQRISSLVMTNRWDCNYRAYQEGVVEFRYALRPHAGGLELADAERFGTDAAAPLLALPAMSPVPPRPPVRILDNAAVATTLKPSDDRKAYILRVYGTCADEQELQVQWDAPVECVSRTDFRERPLEPVGDRVPVRSQQIVSLRAERKP